MVKILLGQGRVSTDWIDSKGPTLLSHAAGNGQEMMIKRLLGLENVDAEKPDNLGSTPLSHAAFGGHEGVVKILLSGKRSTPMGQIQKPKHRSRMRLGGGIREW